jgi:hypothetical protein
VGALVKPLAYTKKIRVPIKIKLRSVNLVVLVRVSGRNLVPTGICNFIAPADLEEAERVS